MELKFIDKIGLELEGAWYKPFQYELHEDRSVTGYISRFINWNRKYNAGDIPGYNGNNYLYYIGELISDPLSYEAAESFLAKNWPDDTMERCGFHIHISFKNIAAYSKLMEVEFFHFFLNHMELWGKKNGIKSTKFWERLRGENNFCTKKFIPEKQVLAKKKIENDQSRYSILNYCYGVHKTIECRLLPTFAFKAEAISAFNAVIQAFELYLEKNPPAIGILNVEIEADNTAQNVKEEIVNVDTSSVAVAEETTVKPKVKDIIKAKQSKRLYLKPYNLFVVKNKAENYKDIPRVASATKSIKAQTSFFDIIMNQSNYKIEYSSEAELF